MLIRCSPKMESVICRRGITSKSGFWTNTQRRKKLSGHNDDITRLERDI